MARMTISESTREYETRLRTQLGEEIVEKDLRAKHRKMADGPFSFLRATYWRWAETILDLCPELTGAPPVLAVGDIHLENFGTWRDAEGRLVWGVNDFDEAAEMPYVLDLVRLATSAVLARARGRTHAKVCAQVFNGYLLGLANPRPVVLDHDHAWLRRLVVVSEGERKRFWQKMDALAAGETAPPPRYVAALAAAMPDPGIEMVIRRRKAGAGSLGRPRWVGIGQWHCAPVVREAKAMVPPAWTRANGGPDPAQRSQIASGRYRAPDPWLALTGNIATRRLSPNNRKIEADDDAADLTRPAMLGLMGQELAAIHLGTGNGRTAIERDLQQRPRNWLRAAVENAEDFVRRDCKAWQESMEQNAKATRRDIEDTRRGAGATENNS